MHPLQRSRFAGHGSYMVNSDTMRINYCRPASEEPNVVSHLPPAVFGFRHIGTEVHLTRSGLSVWGGRLENMVDPALIRLENLLSFVPTAMPVMDFVPFRTPQREASAAMLQLVSMGVYAVLRWLQVGLIGYVGYILGASTLKDLAHHSSLKYVALLPYRIVIPGIGSHVSIDPRFNLLNR